LLELSAQLCQFHGILSRPLPFCDVNFAEQLLMSLGFAHFGHFPLD